MLHLVITSLLTTASVAAPPPLKCRIESVEYELDDEHDEQPPFKKYYVYITLTTSPSDEQRSISGSGALYYRYFDTSGRAQRAIEPFSFYDSVPVDTEETEVSQAISVWGEMDEVYDMRMTNLTCSIV